MRLRIRRPKHLSESLRERFELYGEQVVAFVLALDAWGGTPTKSGAAEDISANQHLAAQWLREQRDIAERHETFITVVEVAVLLFVVAGVALDALILSHGH